MNTLILTEKGSQAVALALLLDVSKKDGRLYHGSYKDESIIIFPLSGHILELVSLSNRGMEISELPNPPSKTAWMSRSKPIINDKDSDIAKIGKSNKLKIYKRLAQLFQEVQFDKIIVATDPDYEGCAIAKEVLDEFHKSHIPSFFMNISNISPKKLRKELDLALNETINAIPWKKWADISYIKAEINNSIGIDVTQLLIIATKSFTTMGTQQTRLLEAIVNRSKARDRVSDAKQYRIRVKTQSHGDFLVEMDEDKTEDKAYALSVQKQIDELDSIKLTGIKMDEEFEKSTPWADGSDIGIYVSKKLGVTLKEMISKEGTLQKLYQDKVLTYARTKAEGVMPISQLDEQIEIALSLKDKYNATNLDTSLIKDYLWRNDSDEDVVQGIKKDNRIINHTPCTLAGIFEERANATEKEQASIDFVAKVVLSTFYKDALVHKNTVFAEALNYSLKHHSVSDIDMGWKELWDEKKERKSEFDIESRVGDHAEIEQVIIEEYKLTKAPLFTESSLLTYAKKHNIGAESTFSTHVETMLDSRRNYTQKNSKNKIIPTEKGKALIDLIPNEAITITKIFDEQIEKAYLNGSRTIEEILKIREAMIVKTYYIIKEAVINNPEKVKTIHDASIDKIGICPMCKGNVISAAKIFYCENKHKDEPLTCPFVIFKEANTDKLAYSITRTQAKNLLLKKVVEVFVHWKTKNIKNKTKIVLKKSESSGEYQVNFDFNKKEK